MIIRNGAVIWARKTMDSEIFSKPDKWFKIWFYLVCMANHTEKNRFKRGQCFLTYELIMLKCGATKGEVDHCVRWLKKQKMLATVKATRGFLVTICNYDIYQNLDNYKSDSKSDLKATQKRHRSDTINKNDNNEKNDKNNIYISIFDEARKLYRGTKRGNLTEYDNFVRKHKDCQEVLPLLKTAIEQQVEWRANSNGEFRPPWKNFQTWINNRCWEDNIPVVINETAETIARMKARGELE